MATISGVPLSELGGLEYAFIDLDGTGLNKMKIPSNGFWEAVEAYEATGGRVIVATGNAREAAIVKVRNDDASGRPMPTGGAGDGLFSSGADLTRIPGVYQNGAEVRGLHGEEISETWLSKAVLEALLMWFQGLVDEQRQQVGIAFQSYGDVYILAGPSTEVEVSHEWTAVRGDQLTAPLLEKWSRCAYYWGEGLPQALPYAELKAQLFESNVHCAMLLTSFGEQAYWSNQALDALGSLAGSVCHSSTLADAPPMDRSSYVFTHPQADKGKALSKLLQHFGGVEPSKVVAFGDNTNDKPMFMVNGVLGVAVANANDTLKSAARVMTGSHEDVPVAGVAQVLNRITEARRAA